jgi:sugar transferase (PEP-CTERM/EpsH1 system associated)
MDILFLSHCVPAPPDKGEKIRSYHELTRLAAQYRVHLACFAKNRSEVEDARKLEDRCASVYVEPLGPARLARAGLSYLAGSCLTASFYGSRRLREHVRSLAARPLFAAVVYSAVMAQYAPAGIPAVLDMVDVDSEKWFQYARMRPLGMLYRAEGRRLRRLEADCASQAACTLLSTANEARLLWSFAPGANVRYMENGVDFDYFDPALTHEPADLRRRFVVFVGAMDYYPNADAACWWASHVFPQLRRQQPDMEFLVVGRNPTRAVRRLAGQPGITVTGPVADVRPYLSAAEAVVAPLRIARGIQNKVLEALAMGKHTLASEAVCDTFGQELPRGIVPCRSPRDYLRFFQQGRTASTGLPAAIRGAARGRFSWNTNLQTLAAELESILNRQDSAEATRMPLRDGAAHGLPGDCARTLTGEFNRAE